MERQRNEPRMQGVTLQSLVTLDWHSDFGSASVIRPIELLVRRPSLRFPLKFA